MFVQAFTAALMMPAAVAAATLPAKLEGVIRDSSGAGISGAGVVLRAAVSREDMGRTRTGPSGTYLFPEIAPGQYAMQVQATAFMSTEVENLRVQAGEHRIIPAIVLQVGYGCGDPVLARLRLLAGSEQGTLSGAITDGKERPIGEAKVLLFCDGKVSCGSASTDAAGQYVLPALKAGKYSIRVHKPGYYEDPSAGYVVQPGFDAVYWPVGLERCRGKGCETAPHRKKTVKCE